MEPLMELAVLIVLFVIFVGISVIPVVREWKSNGDKDDIIASIVVAILLVLTYFSSLVISSDIAEKDGYKQGQIDALEGNIKYEQQIESRTDTTYTKIE